MSFVALQFGTFTTPPSRFFNVPTTFLLTASPGLQGISRISQELVLILLLHGGRRLVLETLEPLPEERKCFRMINGVLVERTIKDVVPTLKLTAENLKKVLDDLVVQYKSKQDEMESWKVRHHFYFYIYSGAALCILVCVASHLLM